MSAFKNLTAPFQKILAAAQTIFLRPWSVPVALLGLVVLAYGLRVRSLGFFWDDWPFLWFFHSLGPDGVMTGLAEDRPFLSFIYTANLTLLGSSPVAWQVFGLLARWLCCLGFWWALLQVWPRSSHKVFWAAALFAVYPGFTQQWISIIYGQAFILFAMVLFSIGLTLWLARTYQAGQILRLVVVSLAALGLSGFTMFSTEYFFGLELLRPVLLWILLASTVSQDLPFHPGSAARQRRWREDATRALRWWAPYLALMILFVIWRGFIHTFPGKSLTVVEGMGASPWSTLSGLILTLAEDFSEAVLAAWGQALSPALLSGWTADLRLPVLMVGVGAIAWLYLSRLRPARIFAMTTDDTGWGTQAAAVGLLAFFAAGWPFWITGLPMQLGFPQDRYTLPLSVGACLLLAGLVDVGGRSLVVKTAVLSLVIALSAGFHFQTSAVYRQDWDHLQDLVWQLTWRAPQIEPNTLILTDSLGLQFYEDDSLTAPVNWIYDPANQTDQMKYLLYDLLVRQYSLPQLVPGVVVERDFRGKQFAGSTSQVLVFQFDPPGCLRVLDPVYDGDLVGLPERLLRAMPLSSPAQWVQTEASPAAPPTQLFGAEPRKRWCYYYEKASLARQEGDWETVVKLARESVGEGIRPVRPQDHVELFPFIEGYVRMGRWDDAAQMTVDTFYWVPQQRGALCSLWRRSLEGGSADDTRQRAVQKVNEALNCGLP